MDIATTTTRARIKRRDLLRIGVAGAGLGAAGVLARGVPIVLADCVRAIKIEPKS